MEIRKEEVLGAKKCAGTCSPKIFSACGAKPRNDTLGTNLRLPDKKNTWCFNQTVSIILKKNTTKHRRTKNTFIH